MPLSVATANACTLSALLVPAARDDEWRERLAKRLGQRGRATRRPIDVDVHEVPLRGGLRAAFLEQPHFIAHARRADTRDAQSRFDAIGKCERGKIVAL